MSEYYDDEEVLFKLNSEILSKKTTYVVERLLGEGGFGAVYKVRDSKTGKHYAMKVEKRHEKRPSKLKMEIVILKLVSKERKNSHFTEIVDRGRREKEGFSFLVMELAGPSLADLKRKRGKVFSCPTGLSVSQQCLEACEDLHKYGFIHRDLKPANYACGGEGKAHTIIILDFGISRKILNDRDELKTPRVTCRFKGTLKFASITCHKNQEMGWKDDCESWFYLLLDLIAPNGLIWKGSQDKNAILRMKEESRFRKETYQGIPCGLELSKIINYLDKLKYQDRVDYQYIYKILEEACVTCDGKMDDPYDWE